MKDSHHHSCGVSDTSPLSAVPADFIGHNTLAGCVQIFILDWEGSAPQGFLLQGVCLNAQTDPLIRTGSVQGDQASRLSKKDIFLPGTAPLPSFL